MGDRNYYQNQYNPNMAQNYGSRQFQSQTVSHFPNMSHQVGGFSVNTSMPVYNAGAPFSQYQHIGLQPQQSKDGLQQYQDGRPPPSYEESHRDTLLSRSNTSIRSSSTWNNKDYEGQKKILQTSSFSSLFDITTETAAQNSPDWSSDSFNSSQNYPHDPTRRFNPHNRFSQQSPTTFSSDYGSRSNYTFPQNNQRGFDSQNQIRGRGRGFRSRGNWHNSSRPNRGRNMNEGGWQDNDRSGGEGAVRSVSQKHMDEGNIEFEERSGGSGDERNDDDNDDDDGYDGDSGALEKTNAYIPDHALVTKYMYYPPSAEEMGEMFKDFVIHFFYKVPKNKKETNPFVVVCESFRRSAGYHCLEVEDGYDVNCKDRKFCTLRYHGMMMVRGVGENNNLKEPRIRAGVKLINKLAMSCYTLQSKPEYFNRKGFEEMLQKGSVPGVYIIAPKEEVFDFDSARSYLELQFSKEDSDVEYMFHFPKGGFSFKSWANKQNSNKYDARMIKEEWVGVCRHRTPQYWRDKILASGSMETAKFILQPPQGIGKKLLNSFRVKDHIVHFNRLAVVRECTLKEVYGPPGVGPKVSRALPPWSRGGNVKTKKNRRRERRIMDELKQGVPLNETRGFKFLSKRKKQKLRKQMSN